MNNLHIKCKYGVVRHQTTTPVTYMTMISPLGTLTNHKLKLVWAPPVEVTKYGQFGRSLSKQTQHLYVMGQR